MKEYSRTHAHYMAACAAHMGESEAMVSEMYMLAKDLEQEVVFLRARLDALAAAELPPAPPKKSIRTWFAAFITKGVQYVAN